MFKNNFVVLFLFFVSFINAQNLDPLLAKDTDAQNRWVDSLMNSMTVDQKIGQLFMVAAYSERRDSHVKEINRMIKKYHVGGVIFMKGTVSRQARLTNLFQSKSKIPLLVGFDGEWGLDMRLKNTYRFPWNMALGAIQDNSLIEAFGKRLGIHCKRLGIHVNFAPVVDVNTNPKNPIIGNRSFGEDKENVTQKAIAFTKGMQSTQVLANAKHFPGHGDTFQDSHKTLPYVGFSTQRIDSVELYPYRKLFDKKIASVMVAHLSVPSLELNKNLPSSLSKNIVTNLLKTKMGFLGLIFTDGLNMGGASNFSSAPKLNLLAFLAGNDVLLIPQQIPKTVALFRKALADGTFSEKRLNESVRKILKAKYLTGLNNYQPVLTDHINEDINTIQDEILHRKLVKASLTLVKNEDDLLPLKNLENKKIAYVKFGDANNNHFVTMLKNYSQVDVVHSSKLNRLLGALNKYNTIIIGFHKSNKNPWKSYKFTQKEIHWIQELAKRKKVVLDVFASPYALLQLQSIKDIEAILISYQNSKQAQELSAQAIFGGFNISGKLPVSINNFFPVGTGITTNSLKRLTYSIPEEVGMSSDSLKNIEKYTNLILKKRMTPGMQILVARHGSIIYHKSFGYHTALKRRKVTNSDVYDLASLTKILATLPLLMKADDKGLLSINSTLGELLPSLKGSNKDTLQLKEVLSHYGKLAPWIPFYKRTQSEKGYNLKKYYSSIKTNKYSIEVAKNMYLDRSWKDSIQDIIKEVKQKPTLRYRYSDIPYYILKEVLQNFFDEPLDKLVNYHFFKPLGLNRTSYLPLQKFKMAEIVPTEKDNYYRRQLIHGYVHDMGAAMQGGVGGHAGLFANANDVAKIMQMYLQGGFYGGKQFLHSETIDLYNTRYYPESNNRRGLGFDKPQLDPRQKATCACVSEKSFGHSGFTGTYTWADPKSGIVYVFLSNRVYPTMTNKGLVKSNMRTIIQEVIQNAIIE